MDRQHGGQLGIGRGVWPGPPGWDSELYCGHAGLLPPPPGQACVALCQAPSGASLLQPGWGLDAGGVGGAGGGTKVKTPGSEPGSPFFFPLWVPAVPATLCRRGAGDSGREMNLWKYPNGIFPVPTPGSQSPHTSPLSRPSSLPHPQPNGGRLGLTWGKNRRWGCQGGQVWLPSWLCHLQSGDLGQTFGCQLSHL